MYIRTFLREITPAAVDNMGKRLLASKAMHEREIELAQRVADSLAPVAHYKKIDERVAKVIRSAVPDSRVFISRTKRLPYENPNRPEYLHMTVRLGGNSAQPGALHASVVVTVDLNATVAELIEALRECEHSRVSLERVTAQFAKLEEVIDAEERVRGLVQEIEETRKNVAMEIIGTEWNHWHDAVREHLPALTGER